MLSPTTARADAFGVWRVSVNAALRALWWRLRGIEEGQHVSDANKRTVWPYVHALRQPIKRGQLLNLRSEVGAITARIITAAM
jgi:hypothetical protein